MIKKKNNILGFGFLPLLTTSMITLPLFEPISPSEIHWDEKIEVATGDAYQGPWRMNDSDFRYVDAPSVDINNKGIVGIVWVDQSRKDIYFQIYETDGKVRFEKPVNVSRSPNIFSWLPRTVISNDDANEIYILWQEIVFSGVSHGGEILFARSNDGGRTFSVPINLSNTPAGAGKGRLTSRYWDNGSLDIIKGHGDNLYITWTEYEGRLWFSRSTDKGKNFSKPIHVAGTNNMPARGPSIAIGNYNTIYLAWTTGETPSADIRIVKSIDGGRSFTEPQIVLESYGHSEAPKIAVDSKGTVHLAYAESPTGPFQRYHIRYSRSTDKGKTFENPREISLAKTVRRTPYGGELESENFPSLSLDGQDNVYLVWELYPHRRMRSLGLGFTYSIDRGETFASPSIITGTTDPDLGFNGSLQGLLMRKLSVNENGEIAIVNNTFKMNERSYVWLYRGRLLEPVQ